MSEKPGIGSNDCIFCRIASRNVKASIVYEDDRVVAFNDLHPQAPVHILVIPKEHIPTLNDAAGKDGVLGHCVAVATRLAAEKGLAADGYRIVVNCLEAGGQTVMHVHFHLLGGRTMTWPPG